MSAISSHDGRDLQLVAVLSNGQDSDMSNGAEGLSFGLGGLITNTYTYHGTPCEYIPFPHRFMPRK